RHAQRVDSGKACNDLAISIHRHYARRCRAGAVLRPPRKLKTGTRLDVDGDFGAWIVCLYARWLGASRRARQAQYNDPGVRGSDRCLKPRLHPNGELLLIVRLIRLGDLVGVIDTRYALEYSGGRI